MSRTGTALPAVAAFTLVVPMLATPAAAAPVDAPQLPVQPPQYLPWPDVAQPWLAAGITYAPSAEDPGYEVYALTQEDPADLARGSDPLVTRSDGTGPTLSSVQPSFSPDGSQVLFSAELPSTDPDVEPGWALMVGDVAPASDGPGVIGAEVLEYPRVAGAADYQPAWSPDGRYVAFVREFPETGARAEDGPQVQILDLRQRDELTEITLPEDPEGMGTNHRWTAEPTWAPDSSGLIVVGSIGESTTTAFAPIEPDASGTGSLWYYEMANQSVHHLTVTDEDCDDASCETYSLPAGTAAWSPTDPATVAYTPWWAQGVELITLPDTLPTTGDDDLVLAEAPAPLVDGAEPPEYGNLTWDPDGSALYVTEPIELAIQRITTDGTLSTVYSDTDPDAYGDILGLAYQPYSDLGITLDVPDSTQLNTLFTMTAEVTNAGPSPSRPGQVVVDVDYYTPPAEVPDGCAIVDTDTLRCTVDLEGLDPQESTQVEVRVPADDHPGVPYISAVAESASPEKAGAASDNRTTAEVVALDDPSLTTDARSQRISFTMDRLHEEGVNNRWSQDLVQSFTSSTAGPVEDNYQVLAAEEVDEATAPWGETIPGPLQVDERDIDYSPDGSRAVFTRFVGTPADGEGSVLLSSRIALANVVGTQQHAAGQPGTLTDVADLLPADQTPATTYADFEPTWSPDGSSVAFVRGSGDDYTDWGSGTSLVVYDTDTQLATSPFDDTWLQNNPQRISEPTWSSDGTALIYIGMPTQADETGTLWLLPLSTGIPHQLYLADDPSTCWPGTDTCDGPLTAENVAWAPDGSAVAFTDRGEDGSVVFLATLGPDAVTRAAGLDDDQRLIIAGLRALDSFYQGGDAEGAELAYPAWSPDSSQIAVVPMQETSPREILAADVATGETSVLFTGYYGSWIYDVEYEPYSDVSVAVDTSPSAQPGISTELTFTVTTAGPSPARDAIVTLPLPSGTTAGTLPAACAAAGRTITCGLAGPLLVGSQHTLTIPVTPTEAGSYDLSATVATNSIDPNVANDEAVATLMAATGDSERIAFSMERPGDGAVETPNSTSLDLVQSVATEPGGSAATDYTVLANSVLTDVTNIDDPAENLGPALATEDNIDFSPDGSQAVFNRSADTQYSFTDDQRLVLADVVGTQQADLGEPGALINLSVVPDAPGTLATDPAGADRVSDSEPVFSPDGSRVAFVRSLAQGDSFGVGQIMLVDADGTGMTSPFDATWLAENGITLDMSSPTWSPDGGAIIFAALSDEGSEGWEMLWYLPLSTGIPHPLALPEDGSVCWPGFGGDACTGMVDGWQPAWAPEGGQVAFAYYASGGTGIAVLTVDQASADAALDPDWTTPVPIAGLTGVDALIPDGPDFPPVDSPAWSPDGERVAVAQGGFDYPNAIVAATLDTGATTTMYSVPEVGTELAHPEFDPVSDVAVQIGRPSGTITIDRATGVRVTVTNNGPSPARDAIVTISLPRGAQAGTLPTGCSADGRTITCTVTGPIADGATEELTLPVTFTAAGDHRITARVATNSIDTEAGNDRARRTFTATTPGGRTITTPDVQVQLTTGADRAWLGGDGLPAQITVTNAGTAPAPDVRLSTTLPADVLVLDAGSCPLTGPCDLGALASGDQLVVDLLLLPTAVGQIEVTASASTTATDAVPGNNTATAGFEAVQAQLRLLPAVAEPGDVTLLYGVDLPPDAEFTARWSQGLTTIYRPLRANEDGTLRASVLIVDGDELGRRTLEVTSVAGTTFGLETPPTLLVVPRSVAPPDFLGRS